MDAWDKLAWRILAKRLAKAIGFILLVAGFGYGVFKIAVVIVYSEYAEFGGKILFYGGISAVVLIVAGFAMASWKENIRKELMADNYRAERNTRVRN